MGGWQTRQCGGITERIIERRFNANFPEYAGKFARVIVSGMPYAQSLIDDFSIPAKFPQIAISVDMLDTGIDVPDVVNLVYFKPVPSKTKYWQMVGRGTRKAVEHFAEVTGWQHPTGEEFLLAEELVGLPSAEDVKDSDEQAKRFDLFALRAQLGVLVGDPGFEAAKRRIRAIANALGEQKSIPAVAAHIELIAAVASEEWWHDVTVPMIELARTRLRGLVYLIDTAKRAIVYTDFADTATEPLEIELKIVAEGVDRARFREKAFAFLKSHEDDVVLFELRQGHQLTPLDLAELERISAVDPGLLCEAPFTGVAPTGPESLFTPAQVATLVATLNHIRETAVAG